MLYKSKFLVLLSLLFCFQTSLYGQEILSDIKNKEAQIWYLGHCGYAVKTKTKLLIFDYWEYGTKPGKPSLFNGFVNPEEIKDLEVYVFVTHRHSDHFDEYIFKWEKKIKSVTYIFGWQAEDNPDYYYLTGPRAEKKFKGMEISTINSNHDDVPEVAYYVKTDGLVFYHGGDYMGDYKKDINYLKGKSEKVDFVFVGAGARKDIIYVLEKFRPEAVFPMHFSNREFKYKDFAGKVGKDFPDSKFICPEKRGDNYFYKNGIVK